MVKMLSIVKVLTKLTYHHWIVKLDTRHIMVSHGPWKIRVKTMHNIQLRSMLNQILGNKQIYNICSKIVEKT